MGEVSPDTVAFWISQGITGQGFRPLLEAVVEALRAHLPDKSPEQITDIAEQMLPKVGGALERIASEHDEDGVVPHFELFAEEKSSYIRAAQNPASELLTALLAQTPAQFEHFCARVLQQMGGVCTVTGRSGDGGVDFVARNLRLCTPAPIGARVRVIGQAKRYAPDNLISENDLRSFVGACLRKSSDPEDSLAFRREILAPAAFAFWTTSDFHPSAKRFARGIGLWYLNGVALSQLALRLGVRASE